MRRSHAGYMCSQSRGRRALSTSLGLGALLALLAGASGMGCSLETGGLAPEGAGTGKPGDPACAKEASGPALPKAFAMTCGGCHDAYGKVGGGFPDLFKFEGTIEGFKAQVRTGGHGMPAFSAEAVSDASVEGIFAYFHEGRPPTPACDNGEVLTPSACSGVTGTITSLFPSAAEVQAITTRAPDGTITMRGAGRVRGRHEREAEFSLFHPQYFENRSYTFIVEDSIPAGGSTIKFTWIPVGQTAAAPDTNLRYWYTGDGNVFNTNVGMTRITDKHWEHTAKHNDREKREIREGDLLEFEFGVFLDKIQGRTNYYTDTFRYRVGSGKLTAFSEDNDAALSGAGTTIPYIFAEPQLYYEQVALNIQQPEIQPFLEGRRLFHTNFTTGEHTDAGNPIFKDQMSKAGPLLNQTTCASCHINNGRGAPPEAGQGMESMVVKLFGAGASADGTPEPHPSYGRQLQDKTTGTALAEGKATVSYEEVSGSFPDGTPYALRRPIVAFSGLAKGPIEHFSARVARPVFGMGLLEAVTEEALLERADALDCNHDGISGRPNLVADPVTKDLRIGRFGWKAGKVSVSHQVADALLVDLGVTTSVFSSEECAEGETGCKASSSPELKDEDLARMTAYMRLLAVPPRRDIGDPKVQRGEAMFSQSGCGNCHAPTLQTGSNHPFVELRSAVIHPYTDLLLHDMGKDLADTSTKEHVAEPSEWRTPPLWGIGVLKTVNGHTQLLHDGRARDFVEAVLWHGGEAASAKDRFVALPKADRDALVAFLESL